MEGDGGELHQLALQLVMDWLPTQDVVSVGQVCRKWREVARDPFVWRSRHAPDMNRSPEPSDRKLFWRVIKFAPFVRKMSVEQPEGDLGGRWPQFYNSIGDEISVKARGLRIRFGLKGSATPKWVHKMLRRLGPHLEMLEVENPGPADAAVIRDLVLGAGPGPRILHTRTWTDQLHGVEAWPAGERPALDVLHVSLVFAGTELLRVFGRTATRLEVELETDRDVVTAAPESGSPRSRRWMDRAVSFNVGHLRGGHVREVALLRSHGAPHEVRLCAQQMAQVRAVLTDAVVTCSACEGANLCRC